MILLSIPLLRVRSATAAQAFYCRGLGFHLEFSHRQDPAKEDPCYMGVSRDGIWLHLSSANEDGICGAVANLVVDSIDDLFAEFDKRKVKIETPPTDQPWGSREMYIRDADGNSLRFIQPKNLQAEPEPVLQPVTAQRPAGAAQPANAASQANAPQPANGNKQTTPQKPVSAIQLAEWS